MKRVFRLTESELITIVKKIIKEKENPDISFGEAFQTKGDITKKNVSIFSSASLVPAILLNFIRDPDFVFIPITFH